jgi:hypothetical protein
MLDRVTRRIGKCFPLSGRGKGIEVLVRVAIQIDETGPNDPAKVAERLVVNLITVQQFCIVAEIMQKPGEFPKRTFCAVQTSREGERFVRSGLKY